MERNEEDDLKEFSKHLRELAKTHPVIIPIHHEEFEETIEMPIVKEQQRIIEYNGVLPVDGFDLAELVKLIINNQA